MMTSPPKHCMSSIHVSDFCKNCVQTFTLENTMSSQKSFHKIRNQTKSKKKPLLSKPKLTEEWATRFLGKS